MRHFQILATYNASFNDRLLHVLRSALDTVPSCLLAQLNHVFVMDRIWLDRLDASNEEPAFNGEMGDVLFCDLADWGPARTNLDQEIVHFVNNKVISGDEIFFTTKADNIAVTCRKDDAMLHLFNHQSLHRGEILRILQDHNIHFGNSDLLPFIVHPKVDKNYSDG